MMKWWSALTMVLIALTFHKASSSRILFASPIAPKSQIGYFTAVANILSDNGHQVTIITPYKPSKTRSGVRAVVLNDIDITKILPNLFKGGVMGGPKAIMTLAPQICSDALEKTEVQALLKEEFDVGIMTIFMSDCFLSLFHQLKVPYIMASPTGLVIGTMNTLIGNPMFPSFINSAMLSIAHPFTFVERMQNTLAETAVDLVFSHYLIPNIEHECRQRGLCLSDMPSLMNLRMNSSLLLINSVKSADIPPRPTVPSIIYAGGLHLKESKPLPKDLEDWVKGAGDDGFIFFSLGSAVVPSSMPEEYRKILVKTFGSLKQRVLWKWDKDTMDDLPPNVRLGTWLPQQDILGHPRLKLFITHGGALSTQESMFHGIPVLGLPVFGDQVTNMREVERQGWGRVLRFEELTPELLKETMFTVINSEELRAEVKRRSTIMRDIPDDPARVVNFWVDYVIRHKGAPHLRSPILSMSWYQLYNVDVWLTLIGTVFAVFYISVKIILALIRQCCSSRSKSKTD